MALIQCTRKLLAELGEKGDTVQDQSTLLGNWHANLAKFGRAKCVLFTNDATLYSFLVPSLTKKDFGNLRAIFLWHLAANLQYEGFTQITTVLSEYENLAFGHTSSRSIIGSVNDIARCYLYQNAVGLDYLERNSRLNSTPLKAIGFSCGIDMLHQKYLL